VRLYQIYRGSGLINATVLAFDTELPHLKDGENSVYGTLSVARQVLAAEQREQRDLWGDAIRRTEAINLKTITLIGEVAPNTPPEAVERGAPGCTCGEPPFAPPEPADDCPFHGGKLMT
jgi:hypothetical protein